MLGAAGQRQAIPYCQKSEWQEQEVLRYYINNLGVGAMVEPSILSMVISNNREFLMEVTDKTRADVE